MELDANESMFSRLFYSDSYFAHISLGHNGLIIIDPGYLKTRSPALLSP